MLLKIYFRHLDVCSLLFVALRHTQEKCSYFQHSAFVAFFKKKYLFDSNWEFSSLVKYIFLFLDDMRMRVSIVLLIQGKTVTAP